MMTALAEWLKQIIIVVLLATFIDLILPNRSLQRYVKLVVSLFILITILSPILRLLGTGINFQETTTFVNRPFIANEIVSEGARMPDLSAILADGATIQEEQLARSAELLTQRVAEGVREHVRSLTHNEPTAVEVSLRLTEQDLPAIQLIHIRMIDPALAEEQPALEADHETSLRIKPVDIEPVEINLDIGKSQAAPTTPQEYSPSALELRNAIAKRWELDVKQVQIEWVERR